MRAEWADNAAYLETVKKNRSSVSGPGGQRILDKVLDVMLEHEVLKGETRGRDDNWVSALHVLAELVLGRKLGKGETGLQHGHHDKQAHGVYGAVCAAVIVLEAEDLVRCSREQDGKPWKSNTVYKITLVV